MPDESDNKEPETAKATKPPDPEQAPSTNLWVHADGRSRRTRPGTAADRRYAKFPQWRKG